jgi:type VI protein secretion system component VasK
MMGKDSNVSIVAVAALCALVWFGGAYFHMYEKWRILIIVVVIALWLVLYIVQKIMAVRGARLIEQRLRAQAQEQVASTRPDKRPEVEALERQLAEAIAALKQSRLGGSALYALPWYIIIGPPGGGKTTALLQSGLNFPYASQGGKIRGVGGTRNCDWWFTDTGILLDTAGRYTTELEDRDEWFAFLDMTKKARKRKPINGALVCVPVDTLLQANDEQLEDMAKKIRDRLDELVKRLELVFPVYLLFTKCDLMNGFVEFFEDFTKNDRGQVWGVTLPYKPQAGYQQMFEDETKKLYHQICAQRAAALSVDRSADKKRQIYSFPLQYALAHKRLGEFVNLAFKPNPFQESAILRGFYFTSGTQEGTPIDQVLSAMGSAFGLKSEFSSFISQAVDKKSYFITKLFNEIVFPDQNLARSSTAVAKRRRLVGLATLAGSGVAFVLLTIALIVSFIGNRALLRDVHAAVSRVREAQKVTTTSPQENLESIAQLRNVVERLDNYENKSLPISLRWGLYRGSSVEARTRELYFERMKRLMFEPCILQLKTEVDARLSKPNISKKESDAIFELHKVYKMLSGLLAVNAQTVTQQLADQERWLKSFGDPASMSEEQKRACMTQLEFLLAQFGREDIARPPVDRLWAEQKDKELERLEIAVMEYREAVARAVQDREKFDASILKSQGKEFLKFDFSFSKLFSQDEWDKYFKHVVKEVSSKVAGQYQANGINKTVEDAQRRLWDIYIAEYTSNWDKLLDGVKLNEQQNLTEAADQLQLLSTEQSPVAELLRLVWTLRVLRVNENEVVNRPNDDLSWMKDALSAARKLQIALATMKKSTQPDQRVVAYMKEEKLGPLLGEFIAASSAIDTALLNCDARLRPLARSLLMQLVDRAFTALQREAQSEMNKLWASKVHKAWDTDVRGRFPFARDAADEVSLSAFSKLFNPKSGAIWTTFGEIERLQRFTYDNRPLIELSPEFTATIERCKIFRDRMYKKEGETISVKFWITFTEREGVTEQSLWLGSKRYSIWDEPPPHRLTAQWDEVDLSAAQFVCKLGIKAGGVESWHEKILNDKQWGLLRLVLAGDPKVLDSKKTRLTFKYEVEGSFGKKDFVIDPEIEADDKDNMFSDAFFADFKIPTAVAEKKP